MSAATVSAESERRSKVESRKAPSLVPPPAMRATLPVQRVGERAHEQYQQREPGCPLPSRNAPARVQHETRRRDRVRAHAMPCSARAIGRERAAGTGAATSGRCS
jgi:hypothetical protein